jgi:hypothetical protein
MLLLVLPFIVLIRLAVWLHIHRELNGWVALSGSVIATTLLMAIYFSFMYTKMTGRLGDWMGFKRRAYAAGFLVFAYTAYTLFYISGENVKHNDTRSEYLELHPILRLSVSTLIILDRQLLITDAGRLPEDYAKMGLKSKKHSLHYIQSDGYTHALDVRTTGRSEWISTLVEFYFRIMGFNTIRHVGTADHLHVSLMVHDKPWAQ